MTLSLLYRMWNVLQDGVTPVTGGKAIGFLFIPFYNIYWFFRVWGGYPAEYNKFLERHRLVAPPMSGTIFIIFAVTVGLAALLIFPILLLPFVTVFMIARGCDAVSNLELAKTAAAEQRSVPQNLFIGTPENPRSKIPAIALAAVLGACSLVVLGLGAFAWFNLNPKLSAELLPQEVGSFKLQKAGRPDGSFFGRSFRALDNLYVSETGNRQAIRYNIFEDATEERAAARVSCSNGSSKTALKNQDGKETGHMCVDGGTVWTQVGRHYFWAHAPSGYDLTELKAGAAPLDEIISFVKSLPLTKNVVFADVPVSPSKPAASPTSNGVVPTTTSQADLMLTGKEFYDETNGNSAAAKSKYKGKVVQITARVASSSTNSVMLDAGGYNNIFAYFDEQGSSGLSSVKRDERLVIKCAAEVDYRVELKRCVLVENKGIVSIADTPDASFSADEYWAAVESPKVSVEARLKKQDELKGKIIAVSGKVKEIGGAKTHLWVGTDDFLSCYPDDENKGMFSTLSEGQEVTFLAVAGSGLRHCLVKTR
jgi:hypothetical protein